MLCGIKQVKGTRMRAVRCALINTRYAVPDQAGHSASGRAEDSILLHSKFAQGANFCEEDRSRTTLPQANRAVHPGKGLI